MAVLCVHVLAWHRKARMILLKDENNKSHASNFNGIFSASSHIHQAEQEWEARLVQIDALGKCDVHSHVGAAGVNMVN